MSLLESPSNSTITARSQKLRLELKEWERSFATANGGRKAGREDIKQHAEIAKKYKAYDRLRSTLSQSQPQSQSQKPSSPRPTKKRSLPASQPPPSIQTPPKRTKQSHPLHPSVVDPYEPTVSSSLTPIYYHTSIAPTAQKDGRVLGLFDLLSDTSGNSKTPSKLSSLKAVALNALATPSKRPLTEAQIKDSKTLSSPNRHTKTPTSVSKRNLLSTFLTPSTRRVVESRTPGSRGGVSKLRFDETPAFLRRDSQRARNDLNADGEDSDALPWSPMRVRTKPAGRGLSALVRGLRELEEEKLDDDLEMLREMEAEQDAGSSGATTKKTMAPKVLVGDSQIREMPLGPDGNRESDSEDEDALAKEGRGRDGKPLRVWKKKGQKRSTRRVIMKPVVAKWKPEVEWKGGNDDEQEKAEAEVEETQIVEGALGNKEGGDSGDRNWEESLEDDELGAGDEEVRIASGRKKIGTAGEEKEEEAPKKRKKIAATAHANFRALKIRNKQSKWKGGGKFGRRR